MIWSIAWRNVWRNKLRSTIVLVAVALGLFAGVFSTGFYNGMTNMRLESGIKSEVSHIQIHKPEYLLNKEIHLNIKDTEGLLQKINSNEAVQGVSRRLRAECFFKTAHGTRGVNIVGIEPQNEKLVTDIADRIVEGSYLDGDHRIPRILVGEKLGKKLKLKIGSKIPVDLVDINGDFSSKLYKVGGFYSTSNKGFDEMNVFVKYANLQEQLNLPDDVAHEIALFLNDKLLVDQLALELQTQNPHLEVKAWHDISKELAMLTDTMDQYMYIFVMIILLALGFGIVNTMLMVVLERVKELGMLMAIGMHKVKVFSMIILESVFLSLTGGLLGIAIGWGVVRMFESRPIKLDIFKGFEQYGYSSEVYTSLRPEMAITIAFLVFLIGIISAIYPAWKATRLDAADAIRTE